MEFLKSGIKTVLGTNELNGTRSPAETVEELVDRVISSTLLEDRRDACRALRALSRKYRVEVGAQGMYAFIQVLQNDGQDGEIISYVLDTLCNVMRTPDPFNGEEYNSVLSVNVGEQFAEMFIKDAGNVTLTLKYLGEYDMRVLRSAIEFITVLITNKTREMQEIILVSPMGVSKLMDLLVDQREIVRNDALLLLIQLTKGNSSIQKIVAFENAFDKIFEIMHSEGLWDGGVVVEDCLVLLLNLLRNNSSNQQFFKEGSYIQRLTVMFSFKSTVEKDCNWNSQKISNVRCTLEVIRALVVPSNQQQVVTACQNVMRQCGLLLALCEMLLSNSVPADILVETIITVAEVMRGNCENQLEFSKVMAPSNPPRSATFVLLMTMINEKQMFALRCAVLYNFQCFLYRNEIAQKNIVQTLLPSATSSAEGVFNWSNGEILCTGLFANDPLSNWFSAVSLMHTLNDNTPQKEELLRVLLATSFGGDDHPITLLEQCTNLLQQDSYNYKSKIGLLMFLSTWIAYCATGVKKFLQTKGTMAYLTSRISANEQDEGELLLQGMCAFIIGLCIQFNDNSLIGQNRDDICQLVIKGIGQENFCNKLGEVPRSEAYSKACKQPQIKAKNSDELLLDFEYCKMYKNLEGIIVRTVCNCIKTDENKLDELTLSSEVAALVSQYKGIIRGLDGQINKMEEQVKKLEVNNAGLLDELNLVKSTNFQLINQNTLLKAQLSVLQQQGVSNIDNSNSKTSLENSDQSQDDEILRKKSYFDKEINKLQKHLREETQRAEQAESELKALQKDQEDLMELLSEQDKKIANYEKELSSANSTNKRGGDVDQEQRFYIHNM